MSKENPLSHHEQLRYDYLFKNIHYLNDRERREFDYLQQKMAGPNSEVHHFYQEEKKNLGVEILIFRLMAVEAGLRNVKR